MITESTVTQEPDSTQPTQRCEYSSDEPLRHYNVLMPLSHFHPAVASWFNSQFDQPTEVQVQAWPAIQGGSHTLIAAPTGSGKTLAAFLAVINELVRDGELFGLPDETRILYVSPLKALSNDINRNLEAPLVGITQELPSPSPLSIRSAVRTGDTPQAERAKVRRQPPHILVTTPESLFIFLTSESGRRILQTVRTVIIDELHAVAGNKRGAHLSLSLERLDALCVKPPVRIGISATQKPIDHMAAFLIGNRPDNDKCRIIDTGFVRDRDLAIELPRSPLQPIMPAEVWSEIYDRLADLIAEHRSTLIFVNTRRLAERVSRHLAERMQERGLPASGVTAHHGSLARDHRLDAEQRLKNGELNALVATASLELGIDIGDIDLTCLLGSPRGIATFLQRVGRSGHGVKALPKGRLFPLSRDDLMECTALLDAVQRQELDAIQLVRPAWDVLAQQIVAEIAAEEWRVDDLYTVLCRAWPYRETTRERFNEIIQMLADGYTTRRGRRGAHLHLDAVNGRIRGRRGARLTAITNGGAIPDQFDYDVVLLPEEFPVGSLNEDFAFESLPGDIFQLGNTAYRIIRIELGKVYVEDAKGQSPSIPFWFGEAPGRSDELSLAVSRLRAQLDHQLSVSKDGIARTRDWLQRTIGLTASAAGQLAEYAALAKAALGSLPTQQHIVLERFFDEIGDTHLVIHSPFGTRLNRAWGLAIRKKFCRRFNFELQAAALDDSIILSLGPTHSFPLIEVVDYLRPHSVREVLIQALLNAPMFPTRWRWVTTTALAVRRNRNGKKVPAQFQRSDADDLLAVIFPDQLACAENITGQREIPDHPLVAQVLSDCLTEVMDVDGLERLISRLNDRDNSTPPIKITARELASPSPLAEEVITARPYAFLDDAPAEERRTQAIRNRHLFDIEDAAQVAELDPTAIETVRAEAWPDPQNADELHDALVLSGFLETGEIRDSLPEWSKYFQQLVLDKRATALSLASGTVLWTSAERLSQLARCVSGDYSLQPVITPVEPATAQLEDPESAATQGLVEIIRSRLETLGPVTATALAKPLDIDKRLVSRALLTLETEGFAMRGLFRVNSISACETRFGDSEEWCERRLLARIGRYTIKTLRKQVEPVPPAAFMRFVLQWQGLSGEKQRGPEALRDALYRLQGFAAPAVAWESSLLPHRISGYSQNQLDQLLTAGEFMWLRPFTPVKSTRRIGPVRNTPIMFFERSQIQSWLPWITHPDLSTGKLTNWASLSGQASRLRDVLLSNGASFFTDLMSMTGLLRSQLEEALAELVAWGIVTSDSFAGLRVLIAPSSKRPGGRGGRRHRSRSVEAAGRWSLVEQTISHQAALSGDSPGNDPIVPVQNFPIEPEQIAVALLDRYGIVFRALLIREHRSLPHWRELARAFRRLEARGEVRGGRFVNGFSGEQFAWPEAVERLREFRNPDDQTDTSRPVIVSAADPVNLHGITTPGDRIAAVSANRLLYKDGVSIAQLVAGEFHWQLSPDPATEWSTRQLLIRNDPTTATVTNLPRTLSS